MYALIIDGPYIDDDNEEVFGYRIVEITDTGASIYEETEAVFGYEQDVIDEVTSKIEVFEEIFLSKEVDKETSEYDFYRDMLDDDEKESDVGFFTFYRKEIYILRSALTHVIPARTI